MTIEPIWNKIAEAYEIVGKDISREITVEMNGMKAVVGVSFGVVVISITEIPEEKPVLIQP